MELSPLTELSASCMRSGHVSQDQPMAAKPLSTRQAFTASLS